jgi:hypothetical protein
MQAGIFQTNQSPGKEWANVQQKQLVKLPLSFRKHHHQMVQRPDLVQVQLAVVQLK